jgi:hypothetical protein
MALTFMISPNLKENGRPDPVFVVGLSRSSLHEAASSCLLVPVANRDARGNGGASASFVL